VAIKYCKRNKINLSSFKRIALFGGLLIALGILPATVKAYSVSLYLSPGDSTYQVGNVFSVAVKVNSSDRVINAAEGVLTFNPDELQVISISKSGSIFNLWTTEPVFSNTAGSINFGGGTTNDFIGRSGLVITINFRPKASAISKVDFVSGFILASDGIGTNILESMSGGTYVLNAGDDEETYDLPPTIGVPAAPIVSSLTHPDVNQWYSNNDPGFSWELPSDVTAIKLLLNNNPNSYPTFEYTSEDTSLIKEKKIEEIADGEWYFHIRFKNEYGWGQISHRRVLVDTEAPKSFTIQVDNDGDDTSPRPVLYFSTSDSLSGLKHYEVISNGKLLATIECKDLPYYMPSQLPGKYFVEVIAFDRAGNFRSDSVEIEISSIESPVITKAPTSLKPDESLIIEGTAFPDVTVRLYLELFGKEPIISQVNVDENGNWTFTSLFLKKGDYKAWARAKDERGALSLPSEEVNFWVGSSPFLKIGKIAIDYLSIMFTLVVLIISLIGIMFYARNQLTLWQKRVKRETKEAEKSVEKAFQVLKKKIEEQIEYLDDRKGLSKREKEIQGKLQEALDSTQETIDKEIKDIEKELEE